MRPAARAYLAQADEELLEAIRQAFADPTVRRPQLSARQRAVLDAWVTETVTRGWPRIGRAWGSGKRAERSVGPVMELVLASEWAARHLPDWIPCPLGCEFSVQTERLLRAHLETYHKADPDEPMAVEIPG